MVKVDCGRDFHGGSQGPEADDEIAIERTRRELTASRRKYQPYFWVT